LQAVNYIYTWKCGCSGLQVSEDEVLPAAETAKAFEGTMLAGGFLPDGSVHVTTVACLIENWYIAGISVCMS